MDMAEQTSSFPSSLPLSPLERDLLLSLVSARKPSARSRLLGSLASAANSSPTSRLFLFNVFLGFSRDPFPYVRQSALDALLPTISSEHPELHRCYHRAVELFRDVEEVVRAAAVRVVGQYGQVLTTSWGAEEKLEVLDEVFVRLCSMARDMSADVRIEAFVAVGKMRLVSEDALLQSLSKKVLGTKTARKVLAKCTGDEIVSLVSSAAGAFIHGLEDELYEVRRTACASLGKLTTFSSQFAENAVNILMDMLNDDNTVVRLQTLETMFHMASCDQLKVQEAHMHMFLSVLLDTDANVRVAAQKLLRVVKLPNMEMFRSSIKCVLTNLEVYPQDESEIVSVLYFIGTNNKNYSAAFVKDFTQKMEPFCKGELVLDRPEMKAVLILSLSAPVLDDKATSSILSRAFVYALPLLGKLSASIGDTINLDPSLNYFNQSNVSDSCPANPPNNLLNENLTMTCTMHYRLTSCQNDEVKSCMKYIFGAVVKTWLLIKSRCTYEALRCLRNCKEELLMVTVPSKELIGALAFVFEYTKVVKLFTKICEHLEPNKCCFKGTGILDPLLENLDSCLLRLRYSFLGFSREEDIHVLELMLFNCSLKLLKVGRYHDPTVKKLHVVLSHLEHVSEEGKLEPSKFAKDLKNLSAENGFDLGQQFPLSRLLDLVSFEHVMFSGKLRHIKVELNVPDNDSENPLPFVSGLPVSITFQITLYNIFCRERLWIRMKVGELSEHAFLDLNQFEGSDEERTCTLDILFYGSPNAVSFSLWASVGMECPLEVNCPSKGQGGPKFKLMFLSKDKEIYLVDVKKKHLVSWD